MGCGGSKESDKYEHSLYKYVESVKDADAVAYAFVSKDKTTFFPYKSPSLASNEIRANILYAGLCLSDSLHSRGKWGPSSYPVAPGHEIIAEVSEVGPDVTNFKKGDKVAFGTLRQMCGKCKYCSSGRGEPLCNGSTNNFTYGLHFGGYSTMLQQPADFFIPIPDGLDLKRAAPLLCAGITVYNPIKKYLRPGDNCAVIGIGGLGHLAVQFLHKMGHNVVGVTSTPDKRDLIKSLGASDILNSSNEKEMIENAGKFDFIITTLPSTNNFHSYFNLLASGGTLVVVGVGQATDIYNVSVAGLVLGEKKIVGSLVGKRDEIKEMLEFCVKNNVYPMCEHFAFEEFDKALNKLEHGKPHFRCVVDCGDYAKKNNLYK